jgi:hypothetical protein
MSKTFIAVLVLAVLTVFWIYIYEKYNFKEVFHSPSTPLWIDIVICIVLSTMAVNRAIEIFNKLLG